MGKCVEWHESTPSGKRRCARFDNGTSDVVLAKSPDGDNGNLGYFDINDVEQALGSFGNMEAADVLSPLVGGSAAIASTLLIRRYSGNTNLRKYAPLISAGAGVVASIPLYWWAGQKAVISGGMTAAVVGVGLFAFEYVGAKLNSGATGLIDATKMGEIVSSAGTPRLTANVPGGVAPAMEVGAFGGKASY